MSEPALVTIPNVALLEVGEDWLTSTGMFTFTEEDLLSAVGLQDAPGVRAPVIKFGHTDARFNADGDFSVGRVCNLRVSATGQTLFGDYVGVPLWLAKVMPSAYPRRSIEGEWAAINSTAHGLGTRSGFYLTAVALLGAFYPAITTLDDIEAFWKGEEPPMYDVETGSIIPLSEALSSVVAASSPGGGVPRGRVAAAASVDDIRTAYYDSIGNNPAMMWWWIRTLYVDPAELIVDDDEGSLYRVPYTVGQSADNQPPVITFGDPAKVTVQYVNVAASGGNPRPAEAKAVWSSRAQSRPAPVSASNPSEGRLTREELCASLGLASDASDADIVTAQLAQAANPANPVNPAKPAEPVNPAEPRNPAEPGGPPPYGTPTPTPGQSADTGTPATGEGTAAPQAARARGLPPGYVLLDEENYRLLRTGAEAGVSAARRLEEGERDEFLTRAVRTGKFPPSRLKHYQQMWAADPVGAREVIDGLAEGIIPVASRGTNAGDTETEGGQGAAADNSYPEGWKPRARRNGGRVPQEA